MWRATKKIVLTGMVAVIIAAAVLLSLARILFPVIGGYRADIEAVVSQLMGQQVRIGELDARWRGVYPNLRIAEVQLLNEQGAAVLTFKEVHIDIDWLALVSEGRVQASAVTIIGSDVTIERDEQGRITLAGFGQSAEGGQSEANTHSWFLTRRHLALHDATVRWRDRMRGRNPIVFSGIEIELTNEETVHHFSASGVLPSVLGREIKAAFEVNGDPFAADARWQATGYVEVDGVLLAAWSDRLGTESWRADAGVADASVWMELRDGRPTSIDAEVAGYGIKLSRDESGDPARREFAVDSVSGRARWRRTPTGWQLGIDRWVMSRDRRAWLPTRAVFHVDDSDGRHRVEGYSNFLQLDELADAASWWPETNADLVKQLRAYRPRGQLQDVYFKRTSDQSTQPPKYIVRADALNVSWAAVDKVPGADGIDGSFVADNDGVFVAATTRDARVHIDRLFRTPITLQTLDGWIAAQRDDSAWRVYSSGLALANADVAVDVEFALDGIGGGASPVLDLVGRYRNGRAASVGTYLPARIMPEHLVEWLDHSIVSGRVTDGGVVVRGPLNRFPFANSEGRFEVRFNVEDGVLAFAPEWPRLERIKGEVAFNEQSMAIRADSGVTLDNALRDVRVRIDDMIHHEAVLEIEGHAQAPLANGLRYLQESPLRGPVGGAFAHAQANGTVATDLHITVPLFGETRHVDVAGAVTFDGNALTLADADVDITDMDGVLSFTEKSVAADGLRAVVLGQPAKVNVRSESVNGHVDLIIGAQGQTRLAALRERLHLGVLNWLEGESEWRGELRIAGGNGADRSAALALSSTLSGSRLKLPPPLRKPPGTATNLDVRLALPLRSGQPIKVGLGENVSAIFDVARDESRHVQLRRGEIRLYDGAARLPEQRGVRVVGTLPVFAQSEWFPFLFPASSTEAGSVGNGSAEGAKGAAVVNQLDVVAQEATLLGRPVGKVAVRGEASEKGWALTLYGDRVQGQLSVPLAAQVPVSLNLERLSLPAAVAAPDAAKAAKRAIPGSATDPRRLPALQVRCQQFEYEQRAMGSLVVDIETIADGVRLAKVAVDDGVTQLNASGNWTASTVDKQRSELDVTFASRDVGRALAMFGYAETIRDGTGEGVARVAWNDALDAFAPGRLSGTVNFKVENGRVLDVEPGAGRIFGLLSIQALPRRLTLDFSDFFSKGFSFDKVEGAYSLTDGVARTDSFSLTGPAAQIAVAGDIDLGRRTYDQTVNVVPNLTGSLPVLAIGAGVVATPIAGAAALLAEKLLRKPVGKLTQATYRVTGPWETPTIQNVTRGKENSTGR